MTMTPLLSSPFACTSNHARHMFVWHKLLVRVCIWKHTQMNSMVVLSTLTAGSVCRFVCGLIQLHGLSDLHRLNIAAFPCGHELACSWTMSLCSFWHHALQAAPHARPAHHHNTSSHLSTCCPRYQAAEGLRQASIQSIHTISLAACRTATNKSRLHMSSRRGKCKSSTSPRTKAKSQV